MSVGVASSPYVLEVHGAAKHTDLTRRIFVYPNDPGTGAAGNYGTRFIGVELNVDTEYCFGSFVFPNDFSAVGLVKLVWLRAAAAGTVDLSSAAYWAAHDELYSAHSATSPDVALPAIALGDIGITDTGLDITGVDANDIITLKASRAAATEDTFHVLGWIVEYTANQ